MTGKNLRPDASREISGLKRRVSDLERTLDRLRRSTSAAPTVVAPPFTSIQGDGFSAGGAHTFYGAWVAYKPANTITSTVADPTRHIAIDGNWALRILVAGMYEIGTAVTFSGVYPVGNRTIAIDQVADEITTYEIATIAAPPTVAVHLSGSRVVYAPAGSLWWARFGDDTGGDIGGSCTSYWARAVSHLQPEDT